MEDGQRRGAVVLGIAGADPGLGEPDPDALAPLVDAPGQAAALAQVLTGYGYQQIRPRPSSPVPTVTDAASSGHAGGVQVSPSAGDPGPRSAPEVEACLRATLSEPGLVVVHLLTHGVTGKDQATLYVVGPDGTRVFPSVNEWLSQVEERDPASPVLFILDVCHAGAAVDFQRQLQGLIDAAHRVGWVLAATAGRDPAYDARLTLAVTQVLTRFRSGDLQVDPAERYIPLRKLFQEVDRLVSAQATAGYPQQIYTTYVPLHRDVDHLAFFPNPRWMWQDTLREQVDPGLLALLDEVVDARHFLRRAAAAESVFGPELTGPGFFHGRSDQLRQLRDWVIGAGPPVRVVTGKPGVGKSALLGAVVCAAHPQLREQTTSLWKPLAYAPPPVPDGALAVVHARRRDIPQICASIARQWHLTPTPSRISTDSPITGSPSAGSAATSLSGTGAGSATDARSAGSPSPVDRHTDGGDHAAGGDHADGGDHPVGGSAVRGSAVRGSGVGGTAGAEPSWSGSRLLELLTGPDGTGSRSGPTRLLVIDAVDESERPADLVATVLAPLAAARYPDGHPVCRLLVGGRPEAHLRPLIEQVAPSGGVIDLAGLPRGQVRAEVQAYVRDLLSRTPYEQLDYAAGGDALADAIGDKVTYGPGSDQDPSSLEWGEFLVAALYVRHVLNQPPVSDVEQARRLGDAIPRDLGSVLELDLDRAHVGQDVDVTVVRAVARAVAHAEGAGMPEQVLAAVAPAFLPDVPPDFPPDVRPDQPADGAPAAGPPADAEADGDTRPLRPMLHLPQVRRALARLRFYLTRDIDVDGSTLYRLFHQGLADYLRSPTTPTTPTTPTSPPTGSPATGTPASPASTAGARGVWRQLHHLIPTTSGVGSWQRAEPYLLRHAAVHAAAAGQLAELLQDAGFLAHADPAVLAGLLADLPAGAGDRAADVYRASYARHAGLPPAVRAQVLAVDAARFHRLDLAEQLTADAPWRPVWATNQTRNPRLRISLTGHTGGVWGVAVGQAGGRDVIVSAGEDGTVRVWDAVTGAPVTDPLTGHTSEVFGVAVGHAAGRDIIASASADQTVRIWDAVTGAPVTDPLTGHTGTVWGVAVGQAGGRDIIVSAGKDRTVRVWDAVTGAPAGDPLTGHTRTVSGVAVGHAGGRDIIVSASMDGTVRVWDAVTGDPVTDPLTGHTDTVWGVAVGHAGGRDIIASASRDQTVRVWDAATWAPVTDPLTGHTDTVYAVAVGHAGGRDIIASASDDGTVRVWDAATGVPVGDPLTGHTSEVSGVAVGRAGGRDIIVSASMDGTVRVWDASTGDPVGDPLTGHTSEVSGVAVGRAGGRDIIVSASMDGTVRVWDASTGVPVGDPLTGHTSEVSGVAVGRAGGRDIIASASWDGTVRVWDASTGVPVGDPLTGHTDMVSGVAVGRAGGRDIIASASMDGTVRVWDASTGDPVGDPLTGHTNAVTGVAVGHAGGRDIIASASRDQTVRVWDAATWAPVGDPLTGHTDMVSGVAVGHAGGRDIIASAGDDGTVRVWDAATGVPVGDPLTGHTGPVTGVAVGHAGGRDIIASAGDDGTVRVWDAVTGRALGQQEFPAWVEAVGVGEDGVLVVGVENDVVVLRSTLAPSPSPTVSTSSPSTSSPSSPW